MRKIKSRNGGTMTEARFKSLIISALRNASRWWVPKNKIITASKIGRGKYKCAICGNVVGPKEIVADHINPVIDPNIGFVSYDNWIERCFVEEDGFQAICKECHLIKTNKEKQIAKERKKYELIKYYE